MSEHFDHGPRISLDEYNRRVLALQELSGPMPTAAQDRERMWQELNLMIDYRLGTAFPRDRRERLWVLRKELERKRLRLGLWMLVKRVFSGREKPNREWSGDLIIRHYSKALDPEELKAFLELDL
jgi:hypothetical protein